MAPRRKRMRSRIRDIVKKARLNKDLSIRAAAKAMEFSAMYLSQIESGKNMPSDKILRKIADFYGLDFFELLNVKLEESVESEKVEDSELRMKVARRLMLMPDEEFNNIAPSIMKDDLEKER